MSAIQPSINRHLVATYLSQGWVALMGVAFLPVYIHFLGLEAYGLIGAFAALYSILVFFDFGISPTLTREFSRFTGGAYSATEIRDLLRSAEAIAVTVATLVLIGFWLASDWLATSWFNVQKLDPKTVSDAVKEMGLVAALRFVESIYRGCVIGLQRMVLFSAVTAALATVRAVGAIAVLAFVSNSIGAFFMWQAIVSMASLVMLGLATYSSLPRGHRRGRPSLDAIRSVGGFASGMLTISILSIGLTQLDKLLLTNLLPLSDFGRYSIAALVAISLQLLGEPAFRTFGPRFARLHAEQDEAGFIQLYHQAAQLVSILAGSAAIVLISFAEPFLALWTQDAVLAQQTAPLLQVLALGYLLNLFVWVPYLAQLAHRWTSLAIRTNLLALLLIAPLLFWIVPRYGAIGAAWVWTALNATYFLVTVHFMHRRILKNEKWRWYGTDILGPVGTAAALVVLIRWILPTEGMSNLGQVAVLALAAAAALVGSTASAPLYRARAALELSRLVSPARG